MSRERPWFGRQPPSLNNMFRNGIQLVVRDVGHFVCGLEIVAVLRWQRFVFGHKLSGVALFVPVSDQSTRFVSSLVGCASPTELLEFIRHLPIIINLAITTRL